MSHRSYFADHGHLVRRNFQPKASGGRFISIVGEVSGQTEHVIEGPNGQHLQFIVTIHPGIAYRIDVNILSNKGSPVQMFATDEILNTANNLGANSFGPKVFGEFSNAQLSYRALGLADRDFQPFSPADLQNRIDDALNQSSFVTIYGQSFDDGGVRGKGVHKTHFNPAAANQDGAIAVFTGNQPGVQPKRSWFFFKFEEDSIG